MKKNLVLFSKELKGLGIPTSLLSWNQFWEKTTNLNKTLSHTWIIQQLKMCFQKSKSKGILILANRTREFYVTDQKHQKWEHYQLLTKRLKQAFQQIMDLDRIQARWRVSTSQTFELKTQSPTAL